MKILLISSNRYYKPWPVMPYGLFMVAASIEKAGHEVKLLDLCFSKNPIREIEKTMKVFPADIIGISIRNIDNCAGRSTVFLLDEQKSIVNYLKRTFKGPIIAGGSALAINGEEILEYLDLPYAACGDGEKVMVEFIGRFERKESPRGIEGLIIRENGKILQEKTFALVEDIDALPLPDLAKYLDIEKYKKFDASIQVQTKRGCALKCSYCVYPKIEGSSYRLIDPQKIADYVETAVKETGIRSIEFVDSTLNIPLNHFKNVLRAIIKKQLNLNAQSTLGLNPASVDEELVDLMKQVGFNEVVIGIDTASDKILKDLQKNFGKEDIVRAAEILRKKAMPLSWYLLVGAPAESSETLQETLDFIWKTSGPWEAVLVAVGIRVYKDSHIALSIMKENPGQVKDNFLKPMVVQPSKIALDAIQILAKQFELEHQNFIIYGDDRTPTFVVRLGFKITQKFFPRMPVIRMHVLSNYLKKWTGLRWCSKILLKKKLEKLNRSLSG